MLEQADKSSEPPLQLKLLDTVDNYSECVTTIKEFNNSIKNHSIGTIDNTMCEAFFLNLVAPSQKAISAFKLNALWEFCPTFRPIMVEHYEDVLSLCHHLITLFLSPNNDNVDNQCMTAAMKLLGVVYLEKNKSVNSLRSGLEEEMLEKAKKKRQLEIQRDSQQDLENTERQIIIGMKEITQRQREA